MPAPFSSGYRTDLHAVNRDDVEMVLLEITHPDLVTPIRVCSDTQDITSGGNLFAASRFIFTWPDDRQSGPPQAQLSFDNVGRDLMQLLEATGGAKGALCRVRQVRRSLPNNIEMDITVGLQGIEADLGYVNASLGYDSFFDRPAISMRYDPQTAPGIF